MSQSELLPMLGAGGLVALVAALIVRALWARRAAARARAAETQVGWGHPVARARDMSMIAALVRLWPIEDGRSAYEVSERTWRDLNMDAVFARIDRCASDLGQQLLYRCLRAPHLTLQPLLELDRRVSSFTHIEALRARVSASLRRLKGNGAASLAHVIYGPPAELPRGATLFPIATVATVLAAALSFVQPWAIGLLLALIIMNIAIRVMVFRELSAHVAGLREVAHLVDVAREIARIEEPGLAAELSTLRRALSALGTRRVTVAWLALDSLRLDDASAIVVEYANVFLLLDVNAYIKELAFARERRQPLAVIFEQLAKIDVAMSVANYRAGEPHVACPQLDDREQGFTMQGVRHPLVAGAVPNDVTLGEQSYLVTGANMAGKSTFLRAVALQGVLAQSIFTTTSEGYLAPFVRVYSLVEIADDLLASRSHFWVEAEVACTMLGAPERGRCLCIVDELFRGTNTVDRISAGAAFLRALHRAGAHVVAATHDGELLALLREQYRPFFFSETIAAGELSFDYLLRPGAAAPRNALAVLELVGFPPAVLDEARLTADRLQEGRLRFVDRPPPW